jgi:hypothetical protein
MVERYMGSGVTVGVRLCRRHLEHGSRVLVDSL